MTVTLSGRVRALFGVVLLATTCNARAGSLDVLLCNDVDVDLWDCFDLVNLYNATDGDNWINNSNWGSPDVDSWHGVIVDPLIGRVISVDLALNRLDGEFPPAMYGLQALEFLQLSGNSLSGELPAYIGELRALTFLQIGANGLEGPLPESLGNLTRLENLFLGGNRFSGPLPESIGNLVALEVLDILSGGFDDSARLTGPLPDLRRLTRLRRLGLEDNRIEGPFPDYLDRMPLLEAVYLQGNDFSGALPANLGSLSRLRILDVSANALVGAIPASLGDLAALEELDLSYNAFTSTLPASLGNLDTLRVLRIAGNPFYERPQVTGPIPASFADLAQIEELNLGFNRLSGTLPECLGNLANLRVLNVQVNDLTGAVPESFAALDPERFLIGFNLLDADAGGRLIASPAIDAWLDGIPVTADVIPGLGHVDSRDQRTIADDPDAVFANGFEPAPSNACTKRRASATNH